MKNTVLAASLAVLALASTAVPASALTAAQDQQLQALMSQKIMELFGEVPDDYTGYLGQSQHHQKLPPGCTEESAWDAGTNSTIYLVTCPEGVGPGHGPLK